MQGFVSPGFRHAYWVCFQFSNLLFAALDVFLRILRSSPVYENHYTNSQILFPSGTHKLVLNEFLSTLWCFLGKQIVYPFCFVARWLGTDLFSSLRGICVVSHLLIITIKSPPSRTDRQCNVQLVAVTGFLLLSLVYKVSYWQLSWKITIILWKSLTS